MYEISDICTKAREPQQNHLHIGVGHFADIRESVWHARNTTKCWDLFWLFTKDSIKRLSIYSNPHLKHDIQTFICLFFLQRCLNCIYTKLQPMHNKTSKNRDVSFLFIALRTNAKVPCRGRWPSKYNSLYKNQCDDLWWWYCYWRLPCQFANWVLWYLAKLL